MLSNSCKHAIRASLYLATNATVEKKISPKAISDYMEIPAPFLAKILLTLAKGGLVASAKGPGGGYFMTQKELDKNMLDIIECIDGLTKMNSCFIGLPNCSDKYPCAVHETVSKFRKQFIKNASLKTIGDLAKENKEGLTFLI